MIGKRFHTGGFFKGSPSALMGENAIPFLVPPSPELDAQLAKHAASVEKLGADLRKATTVKVHVAGAEAMAEAFQKVSNCISVSLLEMGHRDDIDAEGCGAFFAAAKYWGT